MESYGRIRVLSPDVARKIAAGEVIDRPAALVRELVDNAIDAEAATVEVAVECGGSRRVEVSDDGCGMDRENLELCTLPHATSKVCTVEDLQSTKTLGFRGEALAAAASVASLEITSSRDGREAWRLLTGPGPGRTMEMVLEGALRTKGTSVRVLGLFDALPVRKKFLKRDGAEGVLCRQALVDKALAFPGLTFRFLKDGKLDLFLPAVSTLKERFAAALLEDRQGTYLHELHLTGSGFSATIVMGGPELHRADRRLLFTFANGRRIQDYGLIQALEFGVQGWFPNGTHPVGAVFVDMDPALADFNIHPAKREVRFKDGGAVHHALSSALRDYQRRLGLGVAERTAVMEEASPLFAADAPIRPHQGQFSSYAGPFGGAKNRSWEGHLAMEALLERPPAFVPLPGRIQESALCGTGTILGEDPMKAAPLSNQVGMVHYIGRAFGLFILVEMEDRIYLIDQHAAHERILYDRIQSSPVDRQELLVPLPFSTDGEEEDRFLEERRVDLDRLGIRVERDGFSAWRIEALPSGWSTGDGQTIRALLELRHAGEQLAERWAATMACMGAVKDGDYLDPQTALALAETALALDQPRCPHGRPIWTELRKEYLLKAVRRLE